MLRSAETDRVAGTRRAQSRHMRRLSLLALLALGCTPPIVSPPARSIPLEAPRALGRGSSSLQVEGGFSGEVFGPSVFHAGLRGRYGLRDDLDLTYEGNAFAVTNQVPDTEDGVEAEPIPHRGVYSARLGLKYALSPHFALAVGLGGGMSAGGGFFSPDVGVIAGYDNPHVVPFVGARVFLSQPIAPRTLTLPDGDGAVIGEPDLTLGFGITTGIRVPFGEYYDHDDRRAAMLVGLGINYLADANGDPVLERTDAVLVGFQVGLEFLL